MSSKMSVLKIKSLERIDEIPIKMIKLTKNILLHIMALFNIIITMCFPISVGNGGPNFPKKMSKCQVIKF
jgi:hypothetical protein